jgi:hypothetical protein
MAEYNFESLRPHIVAILRAPDVDLATIGGKTVRKQVSVWTHLALTFTVVDGGILWGRL